MEQSTGVNKRGGHYLGTEIDENGGRGIAGTSYWRVGMESTGLSRMHFVFIGSLQEVTLLINVK